ncbi:MAG: glycosyltransferase family 2 protein [Cytophagales bacterium]|nr:glycosyltransferase family 2 protein [Cytophagales bacterium]
MKDIAIVILNWNGKKHLEEFLPSVIKHSEDARIIVADNGSTDDSIHFLTNSFPSVEIIKLSENFGFCGGYNRALQQVDSKYYVILNSDVEVTQNWLSPLHQLLENNQNNAACQPKIKAYENKEYFEHAGAAGGFIDYLGYPFCRGRIFEEVEKDTGQYNETIPIFWATGACLFIRSEIFHELGGFEEDFFAHMEEIDLCWRIKNTGKEIYYVGASEVFHLGGGTLHKSNPHKTFLNYRNGLVLLIKNTHSSKLISTVFFRMVLDGISAVFFLLKGFPKDSWAVFMSHMNLYRYLKKWSSKRKNNTAKPQETHPEISQKSIVFQHFLSEKRIFKDIFESKK